MRKQIAPLGAVIAALFATLVPAVSAEEDYATIRVVATKVIDLPSGPGLTSAILSEDGSRVFSLGRGETCLYAPAQIGEWAKLGCMENPRDLHVRGPWDMRWSPDGDQLLLPTYTDAFQTFRDTDIAIFDPETFTRTVLTEDGAEGGVLNSDAAAMFDVAARWIDADMIAFVRVEIPRGRMMERKGPWLMTIDVAGGEPRKASKLMSRTNAVVYALAISPDGRQYAYPLEERDDAEGSGIYVSEFGGQPRRLVGLSDLGKIPAVEFSADGRFLMILGAGEEINSTVGTIVDVATGATFPIAPRQPLVGAAWAPTGSAMAYLTNDRDNDANPGGLFVSPAPGEPGRLLIGERFNPSTCCNNEPFVWASNNTMLLGRAEDASLSMLYVQLGQ